MLYLDPHKFTHSTARLVDYFKHKLVRVIVNTVEKLTKFIILKMANDLPKANVKSPDYLNFSNIIPSTEKLKYSRILINAEGIRFKHPTTTEFPIQAYLTKQHCPENTLSLEISILK